MPTTNTTWRDVHTYWFGELDGAGSWGEDRMALWFRGSGEVDDVIEARFGEVVEAGAAGELAHWRQTPRGQLAEIVALDQFSRNVYRGTARAFAQDPLALERALALIEDTERLEALHPIERAFVFMPLEHAEDLACQERCVALFEALEGAVSEDQRGTFAEFSEFARKHRDIIARFGRFPHRNELLGRTSTDEERAYLDAGGETFGQKKEP